MVLFRLESVFRPRNVRTFQATLSNNLSTKKNAPVAVFDAVDMVKLGATAKFDEAVEIAVQLGVDPRKPNQSVRGVTALPHGTGKAVRIAVFARGDDAEAARASGAVLVGDDDLVAEVQAGKIDFDQCIATPEMMPVVSRVARVLGPRGLMPNPKLGTVTTDVAAAVRDVMGGQVQFRAEKNGIVHAGIGRASFDRDALLENVRSFMVAITNAKPAGAKGKYIQKASLSSTMGRGVALDVPSVDPASARFMLED